MALLVGFALDQQVTVQKAFAGPLVLRERLGALDADTLAEADLEPVFRAKPAIHRYPGSMAGRVHDLAVYVLRHLRRRRRPRMDGRSRRERAPREPGRPARVRRDEGQVAGRGAGQAFRRRGGAASSCRHTRRSAMWTRPMRWPSTRRRRRSTRRSGSKVAAGRRTRSTRGRRGVCARLGRCGGWLGGAAVLCRTGLRRAGGRGRPRGRRGAQGHRRLGPVAAGLLAARRGLADPVALRGNGPSGGLGFATALGWARATRVASEQTARRRVRGHAGHHRGRPPDARAAGAGRGGRDRPARHRHRHRPAGHAGGHRLRHPAGRALPGLRRALQRRRPARPGGRELRLRRPVHARGPGGW